MASYRYFVKLNYISKGKEISIDNNLIRTILIDYDYDTKNMPIIYMTLRLNKNILDDMIMNADKNFLILDITKFDKASANSPKTTFIKDQFIYFLNTSDTNYTKDIDVNDTTKDTQEIYKQVTMGLLNLRLINNNKRLMNGVFKANVATIIHHFTKHMNLVIEPIKYNTSFNNFIVPPIESVSKLIKYINEYNSLYDYNYRYFMDFDKTYLVSSAGNAIDVGDRAYSSVIINVRNTTTAEAQTIGMGIDAKTKSYIMDVDALNTNMSINRTAEKRFNSIIGVDTFGICKTVDLNINKNKDSTVKYRIERVYNNNLNRVNNIKHTIESTAAILNINKTELDSSIFTINKEYSIKNHSSYSNLDGKFLLSYKKEILISEDDNFIGNSILGFRKVVS